MSITKTYNRGDRVEFTNRKKVRQSGTVLGPYMAFGHKLDDMYLIEVDKSQGESKTHKLAMSIGRLTKI